jgi:tetratricopeptide (TPR) repeat protein
MARVPPDSKKHASMTCLARLAARLAILVFPLTVCATLAHADELQDINGLLKQGQHAKALERVNQYLAQKPGDPNGRFTKGLILAEQNKTAEAIEVFAALSRDYPELPEPFNNLAVLYASQGQYEKARQQLERSIRTHPSYATAYENLGDVYTKLASQAYDKALQFDSSNSAAKNKLSLIRDLISSNRLPATPSAPSVALKDAAPPPAGKSAPSKPEAKPAEVKGAVAARTDAQKADAKPVVAAKADAPKADAKPAVVAKADAPKADAKRPRAQGGDQQAVLQAVLAWADAWSQQKIEAYLGFYAQDFKTPKGEGRPEWEAARRERIAGAKKIEVAVESPKVVLKDENNAVVSFKQKYRSDTLKVDSRKTLVMVRTGGRWAIQQERTGG